MSKRNPVPRFILSASALMMLFLLAAVSAAQKEPNSTTGAPLKGVDVKLGRNPGGSAAARTGTTDDKGQVKFDGLPPGNYSLTILGRGPKSADSDDERDRYQVEITGAVGGVIARGWDPKQKKFLKLPNANARTTTAPGYEEKIDFAIGPPTNPPAPVSITIVRSKSNITNN